MYKYYVQQKAYRIFAQTSLLESWEYVTNSQGNQAILMKKNWLDWLHEYNLMNYL